MCASYKASTVAGLAAARHRGRVYFGPLNDYETVAIAGGYARPSTQFIGHLAQATLGLFGGGVVEFCVYSRAARVWNAVDAGWVDNEWDTQRRRGEQANARITF